MTWGNPGGAAQGLGWRRRGGLGGLCLWPGAGSPATATPAPCRPRGLPAPRAPCRPRSRPPRWLRWRRPRWLGAPQRRESWGTLAAGTPPGAAGRLGKVKPGGGGRGEARAGRTPSLLRSLQGHPHPPPNPRIRRSLDSARAKTRWLFACSLRSAVCEPR